MTLVSDSPLPEHEYTANNVSRSNSMTTLIRVKRKFLEDPSDQLVLLANYSGDVSGEGKEFTFSGPSVKRAKLQKYAFQRTTSLEAFPSIHELVPPPPTSSTSLSNASTSTSSLPSQSYHIVGTSNHEQYMILELESTNSSSANETQDPLHTHLEQLSLDPSQPVPYNENSFVYDLYIPQSPSAENEITPPASSYVDCDVTDFPYFFETLVHPEAHLNNLDEGYRNDEEDEDSNAEDYYANDYPEEPSYSSLLLESDDDSDDDDADDDEWASSDHDECNEDSYSKFQRQWFETFPFRDKDLYDGDMCIDPMQYLFHASNHSSPRSEMSDFKFGDEMDDE